MKIFLALITLISTSVALAGPIDQSVETTLLTNPIFQETPFAGDAGLAVCKLIGYTAAIEQSHEPLARTTPYWSSDNSGEELKIVANYPVQLLTQVVCARPKR